MHNACKCCFFLDCVRMCCNHFPDPFAPRHTTADLHRTQRSTTHIGIKKRETSEMYRTWAVCYSRSISPDVGQVHLSVLFSDLLSEALSQPLNVQLIKDMRGFPMSGC